MCHFLSLIHEWETTLKPEALRRFFSQNLSPMDITGLERSAIALMINLPGGTPDSQLLSEEVAISHLRNKDFWREIQYSVVGWVTHNPKFLDSRCQGVVFSPEPHDIESRSLVIGSKEIGHGRRTGWSFNSACMRIKKFLFTEFIYHSQQISLAEDLMNGGCFHELLTEMGAPEDQLEKICDLLEAHYHTPFPDEAPEPQILIPDKGSGYIAVTPASSHLVQSQVHQRLNNSDLKKMRYTLPIGNGPNVGTFGDLVADSRGRIRIFSSHVKTRFAFWQICLWRFFRDNHLFFCSDTPLSLPKPRTFERRENDEQDSYQNITDKEKALTIINNEVRSLFRDYLRLLSYFKNNPECKKNFFCQIQLVSPPPLTTLLINEKPISKKEESTILDETWTFWCSARLKKYTPFPVTDAYTAFLKPAFHDSAHQYFSKVFL